MDVFDELHMSHYLVIHSGFSSKFGWINIEMFHFKEVNEGSNAVAAIVISGISGYTMIITAWHVRIPWTNNLEKLSVFTTY